MKKKPSGMLPPRVDVVELETGNVIHSVQLKSTSENYVDRVLIGMLTNMNTDKYSVRYVARRRRAPRET